MLKSKLSIIAFGLMAASLSAASFAAPKSTHVGGTSAQHMSSQGTTNTNGPAAATRDHGLARAGERRSDSGTAHTKGAESKGKAKHAASAPTTTTTQP